MEHIYRECGGMWLVNILNDSTNQVKNGIMRTVTLSCIKTIRAPIYMSNIEYNHIWKVEALQGYEAYAGWYLSPVKQPGYLSDEVVTHQDPCVF
jgi:hypothetical protein